MKFAAPNQKQFEVIKYLIRLMHWWETTNDLYSPTHGSDQTSELSKLVDDEVLTEKQMEEIDDLVWNLMIKIQELK